MLDRLIELRAQKRAENADSGFTLIELLVVVVIIGILIAIAIPLYLNYEKGAANRSAAADTRNAVPALNQCISDAGSTLPTSAAGTGNSLAITCGTGQGETLNYSSGNTMTVTFTAGSPNSFTVSTAAGGSGDKTYTYSSTTGQTTAS